MSLSVECYLLGPTNDAPNSRLPVIHYRNVLPQPQTEETTTQFLTRTGWEKRGTWGHIGEPHFHPNTHECYGIFQGHSTLLLGKINDGNGVQVDVNTGDVIVLPAGTAHSSLRSSDDYRYIGVYPKECPKWTNEMGERPPASFVQTIGAVARPRADPVYGKQGPLVSLWNAKRKAKL
ncbi:cupin domain-containing protein [Trichoderma breve]|uniref:Cupin domain-containing protein n=1 Tax=Trichoderma breve TaxID=2034170 RepID=A0A9W9E1Y7_9HYPO|nr:cupin domain-containing protein [Trichoderma breve]KAJ4855288.1 cupin domain-containing protein [Trichoderma breve]